MNPLHSTPAGPDPCWQCLSFRGLVGGTIAHCANRVPIQSQPETGCAFFLRDPGARRAPPADWRLMRSTFDALHSGKNG